MSCELVEKNLETKSELSHNLKVNVRKIRYKEEDQEEIKNYSQSNNIKIEEINTALLTMARKNIKKLNSNSSIDDRHHHTIDDHLNEQSSHSNNLINEQYANCHYYQHHIHSNEKRQSSKQTMNSSRFQKENTDCLNRQHHLSQNTNHKYHNSTTNHHHCHNDDEKSNEQLNEKLNKDLQGDDDEYDESDDGIEEIEEDEGSYTDHDSTTTSTSTLHNLHNMRNDDDKSEKGNCCNCCYCEVFGHGLPTKAPTSRNYDEIRDRLRTRLENKKQYRSVENDDLLNEHHSHKKNSQQFINQATRSNDLNRDERDLDELLRFINNEGEVTKCEKKNKKKRDKKKKKNKIDEEDQLNPDTNCKIINKSSTKKHIVLQIEKVNYDRNSSDQNPSNSNVSDKSKLNSQMDQETKSIIPNDETAIDKKAKRRNQSNKKVTKQDKKQHHVKQQISCNEQRFIASTDRNSSYCKKSNINKDSLLDDVFLPKDINYEDGIVDEFEKELEEFKRFCFNSKPLPNKEKLNLDLKNIVIKKKSSNQTNFSSSRRNQPV